LIRRSHCDYLNQDFTPLGAREIAALLLFFWTGQIDEGMAMAAA
jgi:hypothetical protein